MSSCTTNYADIHTLDDIRKKIEERCILKPRSQGPIPDGEVKYWREIQPLPGEKHFKGRFTPYKLQFKPIATFDPKRAQKEVIHKSIPTTAKPSSYDDEGGNQP
jgi:hypothetical protein